MAGDWGRLVAALGPPRQGDPPALRALRRPRPHPRHQTELLLLLLETPRELCGGREGATPSEEEGGEVGAVGGALLSLLTLPPPPPPAPPRCLLLLATLSFLLAAGDWGGVAVLGALLAAGGAAGGAPAAAAECLRELRRVRSSGTPLRPLGPPRTPGTPRLQPLALLLAEEGDPVDPTEPCPEPAPSPPAAFLLTPAARAQLLLLGRSGGAPGGGSPPPHATGDPAPLHATLLKGGPGRVPPPRLVSLAQHPALPPPLRLFFLLCLLQGGEEATPKIKGGGEGAATPPSLPPGLAAALFPGVLDPPELFLPRFEAAAALRGGPQNTGGGGGGARGWLRGVLETLGGAGTPPVVFCRAALSYRRWVGGGGEGGEGDLGELLGGAAEKLLGGGHPAAPPHLLELAKVLGGSLGGVLREKVFGAPPPPPGTPQLRGVLKVLATPPGPAPRGDPQVRGFLRRVMAAEGGSWGGGQGLLSAAAPLLPFCGSPFLPSPSPAPRPGLRGGFGGGDPDVGDRGRLHAALAAALGPPKLAAVLGTPPRSAAAASPRPPQDGGGGGGGEGGGGPGAPPTLLPAPAPPCRLRCLPVPPPPLPPPPGTPQTPEAWGRALAARGGPPVAVWLRLRVELLGREEEEKGTTPGGDPRASFGDPSPPPPPFLLALQLQLGGGCDPLDPNPAEGRLAALGAGGAELSLTLRPHRPLPPTLRAGAIYSPGGAPPKGGGEGGKVFLAPLPPLSLPLGLQLRPLCFPPPWDPPRRRRAFDALWGALRGHPQSLLVVKGGGGKGDSPPPSLTPFLLHRDGAGGGGGWGAAAALPPRGVVLVRGGRGGGCVELRGQRWGGVLALARLLRGQEGG